MGVLECRDLSKWYGDVIAVNDVTLDVRPGITGLLGPNGAGKTTLLSMAMGLAAPSAGTISVLGEDPWDNAHLLGRIGYVPDGDAPWRDRTGLEAAMHAARLSGMDAAKAREAAEAALAKVELTDAKDKRVDAYSRGMRQRLKFALALLDDPDLLILDEPLLGTDPITRHHLIALIKGLAADGRSVLLSTHILPDVEALTDRIVLLNHGRLLADGSVAEIRDLLDRYPRTVRVGTPQPREMGSLLWSLPSVLSVQAEEAGVVVKTKDPGAFFADAQSALAASKLPFTSIAPLDENVEAIFRYLVGER
jgi:ABC-2 type transport system ATP-binding protein